MEATRWPSYIDHSLMENGSSGCNQDLFIQRNGLEFAGRHLLLDCWGASRLNEIDHIEQALRSAVEVTGATLLHIHLHHFTPNGGISGVAVLAESHISIHTWPERNYAALDIFMCGDTEPEKAIAVIKQAFSPDNLVVTEHLRGVVPPTQQNDNSEPDSRVSPRQLLLHCPQTRPTPESVSAGKTK